MSCNDFIKSMKDAGFSFRYRATNGKQVFTGEIKQNGKMFTTKVATSDESRQKIKDLFKKGT